MRFMLINNYNSQENVWLTLKYLISKIMEDICGYWTKRDNTILNEMHMKTLPKNPDVGKA